MQEQKRLEPPNDESAPRSSHCYAVMTVDNIASFSIDSIAVRDNPSEIAEIFGWMKFVPTRAECNFARRQVDYEGISEIFEPVSRELIPPQIELKVTKDADGRVTNVEAIPSA